MSDAPTPVTRPATLLWGLLLFPLALLVGWLAGRIPASEPRASNTAEPSDVTASARTQSSGAPFAPDRSAHETQAAELSQWTSLEGATAESHRNGKPVLIDFNAEWCGPCQALKQEVFGDPERGRIVQTAVIPVSIVDRRREDGSNPPAIQELQQRYQVDAFPTLVVYSPETGRVLKTKGFGDADQTLSWITQAAKAVR